MGERLTENDVKKIQAEIEYRKLTVRKEAIEAVKEARAQGDLSENFEYYAAKKDKNKNESRIRYLERMLKTAEIVSEDSKACLLYTSEIQDVICSFHFNRRRRLRGRLTEWGKLRKAGIQLFRVFYLGNNQDNTF